MTYIEEMRELAQHILDAVGQLEGFDLLADDDDDADAMRSLKRCDASVWSLVDWLEGDRSS